MTIFRYRAKDGTETVDGEVEAHNRSDAIERVIQMGYVPVKIEERTLRSGDTSPGLFTLAFKRVSTKEITIFTQQLASLIKSGVPILKALSILSSQTDNIRLRDVLGRIQSDVKNGKDLSSALSEYPALFPSVYVALVRSGEGSGGLQEALTRIAGYRQKQEELFSNVRSALAYPILMLLVGIGTISFMLIFVMPRLIKIFSTLGQELPGATRALIAISNGFRQGWYLVALGVIAVFIIFKRGQRLKAQRMVTSRLELSVPLFGPLIRKSEMARFSRTLELLIKNGIPVLKGIEITIPVLRNEIIKEELHRSHEELKQGNSFGKSLERSRIFSGFMTNLIIVGEESGRLDEALGEIADTYERDIDATLKVLTSLLEPIIILVMGLVVGFIVIAMLLPVFQIDILAR